MIFVGVGPAHLFSRELVFGIGAASLVRDESAVWHGPSWASRGRRGEDLYWMFLMMLGSLAHGGVMMMPSMGNLDGCSCFDGMCAACDGSKVPWVCFVCLVWTQACVVYCWGALIPFVSFFAWFPAKKMATYYLIN
jgi:hypothetical protein